MKEVYPGSNDNVWNVLVKYNNFRVSECLQAHCRVQYKTDIIYIQKLELFLPVEHTLYYLTLQALVIYKSGTLMCTRTASLSPHPVFVCHLRQCNWPNMYLWILIHTKVLLFIFCDIVICTNLTRYYNWCKLSPAVWWKLS